MIEKLVEELKKDKTEGSYYHSWQSNIAVAMQDAYSRAEDKTDIHKISNEGARAFLDLLIGEVYKTSEFPEGKENYCPRCYFDDDVTVLRINCKHYKN